MGTLTPSPPRVGNVSPSPSPWGQPFHPPQGHLTLEQEDVLVEVVKKTTGVSALNRQLSSQEKQLLRLLEQRINAEELLFTKLKMFHVKHLFVV